MALFKKVRYPVFTPIGGQQTVCRLRMLMEMAFWISILNMNLLQIGMKMDSTMKANGIMILMAMVFMIAPLTNRTETLRDYLLILMVMVQMKTIITILFWIRKAHWIVGTTMGYWILKMPTAMENWIQVKI